MVKKSLQTILEVVVRRGRVIRRQVGLGLGFYVALYTAKEDPGDIKGETRPPDWSPEDWPDGQMESTENSVTQSGGYHYPATGHDYTIHYAEAVG